MNLKRPQQSIPNNRSAWHWLPLMGLFMLINFAAPAHAQDPAYYGFQPDITTNYIRNEDHFRLGYIRVAVEVMVENTSYLDVVDRHSPLLTDAFIQIFSKA